MELGFIHPDVMMESMTAKQFFSWFTYATLEQVGNPVHIESPEAVARKQREEFETGMRGMMMRQK